MDQFIAEMRGAGHDWFGRSQANLLGHLDRDGTPQGRLVERLGLSKQAVQQLVDDLVARGVLTRSPDPADRRARIVCFTDQGLTLLEDANLAKQVIEKRFAARLGGPDLQRLSRLLARLSDNPE